MRVLAVSGSLRRASHNTNLLRAAAELAGEDVLVELWDGLADVPPYDEDADGETAPAGAVRLREAIAAADAVLFSTPEYNSSVPGQLKNALDWVSRPLAANPLRNVPVAVVGASAGVFGAVWAQAELRKVLGAIGARVLDVELPVGQAATRFDPDGRLVDEELRERLSGILGELVEATRAREGSMAPALVPAAA